MRVHLIKKQTIEDYVEKHSSSKASFESWITAVKYADWRLPEDIKATFGTVDFLGRGCCRVVFDIGGNNYRMICKYHFGFTHIHLFVCWIGTHAEYDDLCYRKQQYEVSHH